MGIWSQIVSTQIWKEAVMTYFKNVTFSRETNENREYPELDSE